MNLVSTLAMFFVIAMVSGRGLEDPVAINPAWTTTDASAPLPLGSISSAALSPDGTLHLLDEQSRTIHRLTPGGEWLEPLGRAGEAPGEFDMPQALEILPTGECLVFGMFRRVDCIRVDGTPCDSPLGPRPYASPGSLALLFGSNHGPDGSLYLAFSDLAHLEDQSLEGPNLLVRLSASEPDTLFVHEMHMGVGNTKPIDGRAHKLLMDGWDISPGGRLATVPLDNRYAFHLDAGPGREATRRVAVEEFPGDREAIQRFARERELDAERLPLLHRLHWLDDEHLLLEPAVSKTNPQPGAYGRFDIVRFDGERVRRVVLQLPFDHGQDLDFLLDHWLVVVAGGKGARDMHYGAMARLLGQEGAGASAEEDASTELRDSLEVRLYDLRPLLAGQPD